MADETNQPGDDEKVDEEMLQDLDVDEGEADKVRGGFVPDPCEGGELRPSRPRTFGRG
ncbi:MAG: hypothetical protein QOF55_578 [Thermoleophilaceae bacterium]|jgi:hypothetical protein|nr:hypothetical protein [Thermoleophilaceae bacterium]